MKRIYCKAPKAVKMDDDGWPYFPIPGTITVHEEVYEPTETGLLDAEGDAIVSYFVKDPIGFVWHEE